MISINLVPQVKADFLKAQRMKRFIMLISFLLSAGMIALVVFMGTFVYGVQGRQSDGLQSDIQSELTELKEIENLERIVTVKNQLDSIPGLHEDKPVSSRMFDFLTVLVPAEATFSKITLNFDNEYESISGNIGSSNDPNFVSGGNFEFFGSAETFRDVNVLADSLKLAKYELGEDQPLQKAFDLVVAEGLDKDNDEGVFFSIRGQFSEELFKFTNDEVLLSVPNVTSSASVRTDLFGSEAVPEELDRSEGNEEL